MLKSISLHPRLVAIFDLFLSALFLYSLTITPTWWFLVIILICRQSLWLIFIRFMYYPLEAIRWRHYLALLILSLGLVLLLLFTDRDSVDHLANLSWYLLSLVFLLMTFLSFWFLPTSKISLIVSMKPHMRWRFIMTAVGLSGIFAGVQALISFQIAYQINNWVWYIMSAIISTVLAGWWWWEYGLKYGKQFLISLVLFFILILQLIWVVSKLPFGHMVGSLILIWIWYILWLLMRFNLTVEGIKWARQIKFLGANFILFLLFLIFAVRWK
ncbi:MAG: hypothetical protein ABIH87_02940 [bacterium]